MRLVRLIAVIIAVPGMLFAQGAQVPFGGLQHDSSLPVEIVADQLTVDQSDGAVMFVGNVVIGQGDMRMTADEMTVSYSAGDDGDTGRIERIVAKGNVVLVNGAEAAQAQSAEYSIDDGVVVLVGDVIMTQGQNALSSARMVINLTDGTARMEGRVRTILQSGSN